MHPSLTDEVQAEKRRDYERVPAWERQRVNPAPKARQRTNAKQQRRAKERNRRQHNQRMRRGK